MAKTRLSEGHSNVAVLPVVLALLLSLMTPAVFALSSPSGSPSASGHGATAVPQAPGLGGPPKAAQVTTVTTTVTVTASPTAVANIVVHVQNQHGTWVSGADVEVYLETTLSSTTGLTLFTNGTTTNGAFIAVNVTQFSSYLVQVYGPTGGSANQTVNVGSTDAVVNFVIPTTPPPSLSLQDVVINASAAAPGVPFTVSANVVNTSNATAFGAVLTLTPPPQFSLLDTGSEITLGNFAPDSSQALQLTMSVSSVVATPGYSLDYSLNFSDLLGLSYGVSGSISLPSPPPPNLVLQNVTLNPTVIQPGSPFSITANVTNLGNSTAFNAVLTVTPPPDISLLNTGSVILVGNVRQGASTTLVLHLLASNNVASTTNTVAYTLTYNDYFLNKQTTTGNLFVPISGNPVSPKLVVTSATFSSSEIHPGENFTVPMEISNVANVPAEEVVLSVNATSPLVTTGSAGDYRLGVIAANGTEELRLGFYSPTSAALGSYSITLNLAYVDAFGTLYTSSQVLVATIVGQPSLVFNQLQFKNNPLTPGLQTFLNAQILNNGGESALSVKVSFQNAPAFLGNTTIFLGSIQPGKTGNATSFLQIPVGTAVGSYQFTAAISYTDPAGRAYQVVSPYTVTVAPFSPPSVSIVNTLMAPEVLNPGTQGTLTIYYKNTGTSNADNLVLSIVNGSRLFTSSYFGLGTLGPGSSGTTTVGVAVGPKLGAGDYMVKIVATYQDANNATYNFTLPLEVTVYGTTNLLSTRNLAIGFGVVIVAVAAYFLYMRMQRSPKIPK